MKIKGAIGPKNEVRKAAQGSVPQVRVVMVAAVSYFRKAGPDKVMRKRFNNVLGHVCTQPQALNGTSPCHNLFLRGTPFLGPNFGPQNGVHLEVMFSVPARFPKTFSASMSLELHRHGWLRVSPFCLAVTLIAAANVAVLCENQQES